MISYAITAYNEIVELQELVKNLLSYIKDPDEVVIQLDTKATDEIREYTDTLKHMSNVTVIEFPLDNHFAKFKNNLKNHCKNEWIFQVDADELLSSTLLETINDVLAVNDDKDVILVPRINTVSGMTPDDVKTYSWKINEHGWVNFPDYQWRIYKNNEDINWINPVHEQLTGFKNMSRLPQEEHYCLLHEKTIEKQRKQNEFYINTFNR
jgi:hypothetical protein